MHHLYKDPHTGGVLRLFAHPVAIEQTFSPERHEQFLTIAWNTGSDQLVSIDGVDYLFARHTVLPLLANQAFHFEHPQALIVWQFNREFYCIVDHDDEVSCVGFLFYGAQGVLSITLDAAEQQQFDALLQVFTNEFSILDGAQGEMLRMLLKRLIIKVTRLGKEQHLSGRIPDLQLDLVRQFNQLVETNYRQKHSVADYADLLSRSPKTLTNLFSIYNQKSPRQVIHDRIMLEAKRLLIYTDKSTKEIAYELGFEEAPHFNRFFKNNAGLPPGEFKHGLRQVLGNQAW